MPQPKPPGPDAEEVLYRGQTPGGERDGEPNTAVVVTTEHLYARPLEGKESDSSLDFSVPLEDIRTLRCDGILCRTVTLETDEETIRIPTVGLNEGRFRHAVVSNSNLTNTCSRLDLDRYGVCPCGIGTYVGCLLLVAGVASILSVVGALIGIAAIGVGGGILALSALMRKVSQWRGANVWNRRWNGEHAPN